MFGLHGRVGSRCRGVKRVANAAERQRMALLHCWLWLSV
ncbi:Unknown protein sequence [Pseudomonas coronafaciens pv. oryzae]|nr:Unknown protein sequence [Pseudomonas coronafaciens pv. oryzae]